MAKIEAKFKAFTAPNGVQVPELVDSQSRPVTEEGYAHLIGDGVWLSAAHIPYEYYTATAVDGTVAFGNRLNTEVRIGGGIATVFNDLRGYFAAASAAGGGSNIDPETPRNIVAKDIILLNRSGTAGSSTPGLVNFVNSNDMLTLRSLGLEVNRLSTPKTGEITSINSVAFVNGTFTYSGTSAIGDSGDAYTLKLDGKKYIFGVQSANFAVRGEPSGDAIGNYFTPAEFTSINNLLESRQTTPGNVSTSEPTNLIFGSDAIDDATGTYRPDVLLGRGGNDMLSDGDGAGNSVYANDRLFGGAGDDILMAYQGNDLLHGGDHRAYGNVNAAGKPQRLVTLENDGIDIASYVDFRAAHATGAAGIAILVTADAARKDSTFANTQNPDVGRDAAVFVRDLSTDPQYVGSVDTLISIEKIIGTDASDVLSIDSLTGLKLAGPDGKGGLHEVVLGESGGGDLTNFAFAGLDDPDFTTYSKVYFVNPYRVISYDKGDVIDLHLLTEAVKVDLSAATPGVFAIADPSRGIIVRGAENVIGSTGNDEITGDAQSNVIRGGGGDDILKGGGDVDYLIGGDGNDTLIGDGNDALNGGAGADIFKTYLGASRADSIITLTDVGDKVYVNDILFTGTFRYAYSFDITGSSGKMQVYEQGDAFMWYDPADRSAALGILGGPGYIVGVQFFTYGSAGINLTGAPYAYASQSFQSTYSADDFVSVGNAGDLLSASANKALAFAPGMLSVSDILYENNSNELLFNMRSAPHTMAHDIFDEGDTFDSVSSLQLEAAYLNHDIV
jgi:Ca2+-binding RTX toxin-like protein